MANSETVAIPVVAGLNVNTPARLLDPAALLEAQNTRFPRGAGAKKRRGHAVQQIRGAKPIPVGWTTPQFTAIDRVEPYFTGDRHIPSTWVLGYGYHTGIARASAATPLETSAYPDGLALGMAARDEEELTWDGHRLLSRTNLNIPGGKLAEFNAVMPALRAEPFAKTNTAQSRPDCADNGVIRAAAWLTGTTAYYSVYDSALGTSIVPPTAFTVTGVIAVRCLPVGPWIHFLISDGTTLQLRSVHQDTPSAVSERTLGDCNGHFDFCKISESSWLLVQSQITALAVRVMDIDGSLTGTFIPAIGAHTSITTVGITIHPVNSHVGIVWRGDSNVKACVTDLTNSFLSTIFTFAAVTTAARPVAIAPKYVLDSNSDCLFNVYWDDWSGAYATLFMSRFAKTSGILYTEAIYHHFIGSQAFRVGDRTFIWAGHRSTFQSTWVLLDESLRPVGHLDYVGADVPASGDFPRVASVNWAGEAPDKDRCVFHCGLGYRIRVPVDVKTISNTPGTNAPAVYTEPTIRFCRLDFLPPLRAAQAGRSTYFAGAQLWAYDGAELTEAGFHYGPEDVSVAPTTGSLTGSYIYRVDLCYRNAQNEEIRSNSFYTSSVAPSGQGVLLTIPTVLTRRANAYFLIFRNENAGTLWKLVNSRDPASAQFLKNDQSVREVTYTDNVSDGTLLSREQHPNQIFEYLDPFAAPACEVIAAGRDRLWLAGGEIPFGQVYPSRLFEPGEVPAFHGDLALQVDRSAEPITAIGFVGQYAVIFRRSHTYIEDGDGPDNIQQGDWTPPRLAFSDLGAVGPEALALVAAGLTFQSPAGIRLITPGGEPVAIGQPMDALAKDLDITAALVISGDQEVRFYSYTGTTLVWNYQYNTWSRWDVPACGAVRGVDTGLATICTPTGSQWVETEGLWKDGEAPYRHRIRFGWLRAGSLVDFQRVRRIAAVGTASSDHDIHVDVYYDERDFAGEWFDWSWPDSSDNNDTFGSLTFGSGDFGDNTAGPFKDVVWRWRRRLHRQKCSVVSVAIDDNYTDGEGFTLVALGLELARKRGLDRSPWRGGTYSNTGGSGSLKTGA